MSHFPCALPWSERKQLPPVSAVYAFFDAEGAPLYVGSSCNMQSRMKAHHRQKMLADGAEVRWLPMDESEIRDAEAALIEELSPLWNGVDVPVGMRPGGSPSIQVVVPPVVADLLRQRAKAEGRTVSNLSAWVLESAMRQLPPINPDSSSTEKLD